VRLFRYADEPNLRAIRYETLSLQTFPEYLQNNVPGNKYWGRLYEDFPDFQLGLLDGDELVAEFHSVPTPLGRDGGGSARGVGRSVPASMVMDCPVSEWEEWTGMRFPSDGDYVVPEMLAPLYVRDGRGRHVEPNVWLRHRL